MNLEKKINKIKETRNAKVAIQRKDSMLSRPLVKDFSLIGEVFSRIDIKGKVTRERKAFVFVILLLYAPSKLGGGKIPRKVMQWLSKTIGCSTSVISHTCDDVALHYSVYEDFRALANDILDVFKVVLEERGMDNGEFEDYLNGEED